MLIRRQFRPWTPSYVGMYIRKIKETVRLEFGSKIERKKKSFSNDTMDFFMISIKKLIFQVQSEQIHGTRQKRRRGFLYPAKRSVCFGWFTQDEEVGGGRGGAVSEKKQMTRFPE